MRQGPAPVVPGVLSSVPFGGPNFQISEEAIIGIEPTEYLDDYVRSDEGNGQSSVWESVL